MKINKIKYYSAVVILLIATAFGGCTGKKDDIIVLDEAVINADSLLEDSLRESDGLQENQSSEQTDPNIMCVYVCGAVDSPGVYMLSGDIRVIDAITAAGGMREDAGEKYINLASKVCDGEKIYVPTTVEIEEAFAAGDETLYSIVNVSKEDSSELININSADKDQLMTLPGIGASKADKIIEYREKNGGFKSTEDLMLISGIKQGLYNKVKDKIVAK